MFNYNSKAAFYAFIGTFLTFHLSLADDILGCGGFVKSHTNIDYTKVHIKLYTKSGSLKDQTDCAPNNGYYFLPLYDKGEYILKVDPPKGWSFEPTEVNINIDGLTDLCSQGKDVNFVFKGFGITGKVMSKSSNSGPKGVTVTLYSESDRNSALKTTTTETDGTFYFTPIRPGKYVLIASHPVWHFEKNSVAVTVSEGNTEIPDNSLIVFGYDVNGQVTSEGDPVVGVSFLLFGDGSAKKCLTSAIKGYKQNDPLCHVTSDKNGRFVFPAVTVGKYKIVPFYAGTQTKFEVQPAEHSFQVNHDSLILPQDFKVTGFSVFGLVKTSVNGEPLEGVKIFLSGKQVAVTDKNGKYKLDNIKAATYQLGASADNFSFPVKQIKIFPSEPEVPTIYPKGYNVCGKVTLPAKGSLDNRKVNVQNVQGTYYEDVGVDSKTGEFCTMLAADAYNLKVIVTEDEKKNGLQFFPLVYTTKVVSSPIKGIQFLQLKATLKGTVQCSKDADCSRAKVTLKMFKGATVQTIEAKDGKYEFKEILPGHYEILIDNDILCWASDRHEIVVSSEQAQIPAFVQTGYSMTFISSHQTNLDYIHAGKTATLLLKPGSNKHCLPRRGNYEFVPSSCHVFPKPSYIWDTSNPNPLTLTSTIHRQKGIILSGSPAEDVRVRIKGPGEPLILDQLRKTKTADNKFQYEFTFEAEFEKLYEISPLSELLLFEPKSLNVTGLNDCINNIATFSAELGKILSGSVVPPLEGVTIKIFADKKEEPLHTLVTKQDGSYRVGPLSGRLEYSIIAEKEGYVISGPDKKGQFSAHKLAEIIVEVHDQASGVSLQGALLSLTGGASYRKNSVTGDNGQMVFNSLSPGKYYLRPMMKEYKFEPVSKMINVEEGSTIKVTLLGTRVAFSAYGSVTSLNREPEPGLIVEAQGQANCSNLEEEATTEDNGQFRIRGLQPTCIYAIRLKPNSEANSRIQRATPSSIAVQATEDINNLRLVVFHSMSRVDLTVQVQAENAEHYRSLRLKLCREDNPDSPIHTIKLDSSVNPKTPNVGQVVHFPSLQFNQKYFLQLDSSLSKAVYKYKTTPVYFEANSSFKYFKMNFETERKQDHGDMNQTSVVALPFIMLVALAFLYRDKLRTYLNTAVEQWSKPVPLSRSTPVHAIPIDPRADDIIVEQIMNINKRKTKARKV